jgi:hypothetical protein
MLRIQRNIGFDDRMFLEEAEWLTYRRRRPVRYIRRPRALLCELEGCGLPGTPDNPLQSAHIIGFDVGVIDLGLTPDFLDSNKNIVTACRRKCNKKAELNLRASMMRLHGLGVKELPKYLPAEIRDLWESITGRAGEGPA